MATRYSHTFTWDASAADVYAMITDPGYQEQRSQAGNPIRAESSVTPTAAGATISVFRQMRIDPPSFIKSFVGDSIGIKETQTWAGPTAAILSVQIVKQPGGVEGTLRLSESGGSTTVTVDAEITVKAPLIGGKIEGYVAGILDRLLKNDEELGRDWLAKSS